MPSSFALPNWAGRVEPMRRRGNVDATHRWRAPAARSDVHTRDVRLPATRDAARAMAHQAWGAHA